MTPRTTFAGASPFGPPAPDMPTLPTPASRYGDISAKEELLQCVAQHPGRCATDLIGITGLSPNAVYAVLRRLSEGGLLKYEASPIKLHANGLRVRLYWIAQ